MDRTQLEAAAAALPLFPLAGTVLMPGAVLPLHVFEPRYRQLVKDCLRKGLPLSVPQIRAEEQHQPHPTLLPYAAAGFISAHHALPDGRFNILIVPISRIRILDEPASDTLYRVAHVEVLLDEEVTTAALERLGEQVRILFLTALGRMGKSGVAGPLLQVPSERVPEAIAPLLLQEDDARQEFLADNNPLHRAERVHDAVLSLLAETSGTVEA